jgi:hypothetical protein
MRWYCGLYKSYLVVSPPLRTLGLFALLMVTFSSFGADSFAQCSQFSRSNHPPTAYCTKVLSTPDENGKALLPEVLRQGSAALLELHGN